MIELIQGDCLEEMKKIPDGSIDLVLTDPPYGTTACKWDSVIPFEPMWERIHRVVKPNAAVVLFSSQPFTSALVMGNVREFKYQWVWNKGVGVNFFHVKRQPLKTTEDICVFAKSTTKYNPIMVKRDKPIKKSNNNAGESSGYTIDQNSDKYVGRVYTEKYPEVLINFTSREKGRGLHPTQKPVALMEYLIKTYTNEGETVLDFTMGSGTTGVACKNLNRNFIGIELDGDYFAIAKERIGV